MEKKDITITYQEYASMDELPEPDARLLKTAEEATLKAYAPYSHYQVGAAVRLANGVVITGNNQENAAYPSGLCAERVALFAASSQYPGIAVTDLAISAHSDKMRIENPVSPCGSCRQVMAEYQTAHHQEIRVILGSEGGRILIMKGIQNLLPLMFEARDLGIDLP